MQVPLEVTYREVDKNDFIDDLIRRKAAKLEKACPHLISCRVVVALDQKQQRTGNIYRVHINMLVPPGHTLTADRKGVVAKLHEDLPPLIREAFDAANRQVRDLATQQKGKTKLHPEQQTNAFVHRLFTDQDYGFIRTVDGQDIYFHRNSLLNANFDTLELGTGVAFEATEGDEGLQASTVRVIEHKTSHVPSEQAEMQKPLGWKS
ncbi:cold-shock DNA-binding protein family [Desulfocurvibacter africanus PCS]|jgi:cold shock CspA family protein|uniref:Cold-shock DNA-binding protein family n=1 Tax=Desulfocurvibacter africanus PCS TaxID=1262666 RepID=M5PVM2_DESAF|nr:HPF/RaiA family ribosome-associated protein [Desulfocurvibacter africanus]EMG38387.1 cold-shock DNA-binding protein family [Desulfocurvibacter africanus PCS]